MQIFPRDPGSVSGGWPPKRVLWETVTQWTARRTYHVMLDALGGFKQSHQKEIIARGYGYKMWVENLDALLGRMGIEDSQFKPVCEEVVNTVPVDEYEDAIIEKLKARVPLDRRQEYVLRVVLQHINSNPNDFADLLAAYLG